MWRFAGSVGTLAIVAAAAAAAQPPHRGEVPRGPRDGSARDRGDVVASSVARIMALDENQDGQLTKAEMADPRLQSLFERADVDKNESVSKQEITDLFTREARALKQAGRGQVPGGPEGPGRFGPRGGPGGPPRPGQVLPPFLQEELRLTPRQRGELVKLQQDVDARLEKILTPEQLERLRSPRQR